MAQHAARMQGTDLQAKSAAFPMERPRADHPDQPRATLIRSFTRLSWATLGFVVAVILFGAVVRITGSGAGCGQHWPTCNGEIAHLPRTTKTAIEYTHRLSSGLCFVAVVAISILATRRFTRPHLARRMAGLAVVFMIVEALIGAALVRFGLVGSNASPMRAVVMSLHLVNTSALSAALALLAWVSRMHAPELRAPRAITDWLLWLGLFGVLLVSVSGAVTALGDTLYPVRASSTLGTEPGVGPMQGHFLQQLRVVHPITAFAVGGFLLYLPWRIRDGAQAVHAKTWRVAVFVLALVQLSAGVVNIWLSAPGWMQVIHLALAQALWMALILTWAATAVREASALATRQTEIRG